MSDQARDLLQRNDGKDWARRLVSQYHAGRRRSPTVYRFAFEALQLPVPDGVRA